MKATSTGRHRFGALPALTAEDSSGSVAAPHEMSVSAGKAMLRLDGNAVDAAVAAALVAGVIEPGETTLAGSGFLLFNDPKTGVHEVDFGPISPRLARPDMFEIDTDAAGPGVLGVAAVRGNANVDGPLASCVPRTLSGLVRAHAQWGRLPLSVVMEPAISAAEQGFAADTWFVMSASGSRDRLRRDPTARSVFLQPDGTPIGADSMVHTGASFVEGPRVRQNLLAATLRQVAEEGPGVLLDGDIAHALVSSNNEAGGILSIADFAAAAPRIGVPRSLDIRDVTVSVPSAPSSGITQLQILQTWSALYPDGSAGTRTASGLADFAYAASHAFADRYHWLGDPDQVSVPVSALLSSDYAREIARQVHERIAVNPAAEAPWQLFSHHAAHDPWKFVDLPPVTWSPAGAPEPSSGTTHISVADKDGRTVSVTHTAANQFGSGVMCPRTGLLFDSAMAWFNPNPGSANSIRGGARPLANMGPALVTSAGTSLLAVGASGGRRIISAMAQILINYIDGPRDPNELLRIPRIDASGPSLIVHDNCPGDLETLVQMPTVRLSEPRPIYSIDLARPNLAAPTASSTLSAIDAHGYSA
jgi:gamma-glutamyltranspeptidase/glutathione hydrolase